MTDINGLHSDAWLSQLEKRAAARRSANIKKAMLIVVWAVVMGFAVVWFMDWWVTLP